MSDQSKRPEEELEPQPSLPEKELEEEKAPFVPASVEKRIAAWMGIAYALMFLGIITFSLYCPGRSLAGTFPLFLVPVAAAAAVTAIYRQTKGTAPGGMVMTVIIVVLCAAAAAFGLLLGLPALIAAFAG